MAYLRDYAVTVAGLTITPEIDCKFLVKQATVQSTAQAEIRLYNLADATAQAIPQSGGTVTLAAGYQDEGTSTIFTGDLRQRRIGREDPVTTFVDLFCAGGDNAYNFATVSKTLSAGSKPMDHLQAAVQAMSPYGVTLGYVTPGLLDSPSYPRAVTWHNMARDVVRTLAQSAGAKWWIDSQTNQLNVVQDGDSVPGGPIPINSQTGLIGQPVETPDGIEVRTLLSVKIGVGAILQIDQASIQRAQLDQSLAGPNSLSTQALSRLGTNDGVYRVLYIERRGHYRGQEWYNDCICIGALPGSVAPQSLTNIIGKDASVPNFSGAQ